MAPSNKTSQQHTKVAYRPLTDLARIDELDLEAGGGDEADDDDREELEAAAAANNQLESSSTMTKDYASTMRRSYHSANKQHTRQVLIGLRQLRTILLALAALLSLIFLLKLIAYSSQPAAPSKSPTLSPKPISSKITWPGGGKNGTNQALDQVMSTNTTSNKNLDAMSKQQVAVANESDNYLSSIIYERDHRVVPSADGRMAQNQQQQQPDEQLLDDFRYSLGDRRTTLSNQTQDGSQPDNEDDYTASTQNYKWWSVGKRGVAGEYTTVMNFIRPMKSFNRSTSVTLATHLTLGAQSFRHTLELCERWQGPISVAVHLSRGLDYDLPAAITLIKFVRQCLPGPLSACMRDKLTWHLVFEPANHVFAADSLSYPKYHLDSIHYSAFANTDQCPKLAAAAQDGGDNSSGSELISQFEQNILEHNNGGASTTQSSKPIPENVLRNVARSAVQTKWVLASNVDMYPSLDMAPRFISLVASLNQSRPRLFALPTFELINCTTTTAAGQLRTKEELSRLVTGGRARVFQEPNCDRCHQFARMRSWLALVPPSSHQADIDQDSLTIFETTTTADREGARDENGSRQMWQPFFIAESRLVPEYNEALASDRSQVMQETCLEDYQTVVLADAFLVRQCQIYDKNQHSVSVASSNEQKQQQQLIGQAQAKLRQRYETSPNMNKCLG